jgi:hypothetical protein
MTFKSDRIVLVDSDVGVRVFAEVDLTVLKTVKMTAADMEIYDFLQRVHASRRFLEHLAYVHTEIARRSAATRRSYREMFAGREDGTTRVNYGREAPVLNAFRAQYRAAHGRWLPVEFALDHPSDPPPSVYTPKYFDTR